MAASVFYIANLPEQTLQSFDAPGYTALVTQQAGGAKCTRAVRETEGMGVCVGGEEEDSLERVSTPATL